MSKLQIIAKLWSAIYDIKLFILGQGAKTMEDIDKELDLIEYECRRYADTDDIETHIRDRPVSDSERK